MEVQHTDDVILISRAAGIPDDFQGCHLAFVEDYVVSGHVPVEAVRRLLTERPAIAGITLPGMPMGAPGMTGDKAGPFTIYTIGEGAPRSMRSSRGRRLPWLPLAALGFAAWTASSLAPAMGAGDGTEAAAALGRDLTPACASCHGADLEGQPDWSAR